MNQINSDGSVLLPQYTAEQGQMFERPPQEQTPIMGGPHFEQKEKSLPQDILEKIKAAQNNGWQLYLRKFARSRKNLTLIVLILAGASLAVSIAYITLNTNSAEQEESIAQYIDNGSHITAQSPSVLTPSLPNTPATGQALKQVAGNGDGITHLARRAIWQYISDSGKTLNAEQRIYAEDFLKDIQGSFPLYTGQELTFAVSDIENAYTHAFQLSEVQLAHLKQFTIQANF